MNTPAFFWHYLRRYTGWAMLAAVGIVAYASAQAATGALLQPIFREVLLAKSDGSLPLPGISASPASERGAEEVEETGVLADLKKRFNLQRQFDRSYNSLKRRVGVEGDEVVYFVPLLFVGVFLLRCLADFVSGYAFQNIGLGVTTDIRNDLYRT
ncbi:MAG TPA: hypothetical protein VNW71_19845, partial [Thermoanaerobaculia bacterium]|nr:hypothetical protein [Thermoanaerobaculia bacterium]